MPSGKKARGWGSGLMDDTYAWATELGQGTGLALQISLSPTRRRGVWRVLVRALEVVDGKPQGIRVQHAVDWPDATYTSLDGVIFQAVSHLALLVDDDGLQQGGAAA